MRLPVMVLLAGAVAGPALEAQTPGPGSGPRQTMSQIMVDILYPAGDAVFYIATRTPTNDAEWAQLEAQTLSLAETATLLMMPSRARDTGRWMSDARLMLDAGLAAYRAARARDVRALEALNDALYMSCVTCHEDYRRGYGRRGG
jgi:cytochrome c556